MLVHMIETSSPTHSPQPCPRRPTSNRSRTKVWISPVRAPSGPHSIHGAKASLLSAILSYIATILFAVSGPAAINTSAKTAEDSASGPSSSTLTVTITTTATSPVNGSFPVAITFSESVTGFALDDLAVANGAASELEGTGALYTAVITPATSGTVTVVAVGTVQDNSGTPTPHFSITADLPPPFPRQPLSRPQIVRHKRRTSTLPRPSSIRRATVNTVSRLPATGRVANFSHLNSGTTAHTLYLRTGDIFTIAIHDTCLSRFSYSVRGIREDQPDELQAGQVMTVGYPELTTKTMDIVHDDVYGGYYIYVTEATPSVRCRDENQSPYSLGNAMFIINTPKRDWTIKFSGAFTLSGLTDPLFFSNKDNNVAVDRDNVDVAKPGIATFVHMYDERLSWSSWFAPMFGLGITDNNQTEYYFGGGMRLGEQATINTGVVFGPVSRLPAGTKSLADNQALSDLPTRMTARWFLGISFSIIDVGVGQLQGPFAGSNDDQ